MQVFTLNTVGYNQKQDVKRRIENIMLFYHAKYTEAIKKFFLIDFNYKSSYEPNHHDHG